MQGISIKDIIADVKQDIQTKKMEKTASVAPQEPAEVNLEDLGLDIVNPTKTQEGITKIASALNEVNSLDELVKVAEEAGQTEIADLIKIADAIGDRIADRVISRLQQK